MKTYLITAAAALFLMGCAGEPVLTRLPVSHPANPNAPAAPYTPPDNLLLVEPAPPPPPPPRPSSSPATEEQGGINGMEMNMSMPGMEMHDMDMEGIQMNHHTTNHHHPQGDQP